jgi:hypothetical protein
MAAEKPRLLSIALGRRAALDRHGQVGVQRFSERRVNFTIKGPHCHRVLGVEGIYMEAFRRCFLSSIIEVNRDMKGPLRR